jgi:hypothetical protein
MNAPTPRAFWQRVRKRLKKMALNVKFVSTEAQGVRNCLKTWVMYRNRWGGSGEAKRWLGFAASWVT